MSTDYYRIEKAIQYIEENFKNQPSLDDIASNIGLSPFHFQRLFKRWAGITPKQFLELLTIKHTKEVLKISKNTFDATFSSGLSSTSRLHDLFITIEAITPAEFKSNGKNLKIYYAFFETLFGKCLIAVTDKGICKLSFVDSNEEFMIAELKNSWPNAKFIKDRSKTLPFIKEIFEKQKGKINIVLKGTNFQVNVWKALLTIPEGNLSTYAEIAKAINNPKAIRAVSTAIGNNPICYLIPCHRVIRKTGVIGEYKWGNKRKKAILAFETKL